MNDERVPQPADIAPGRGCRNCGQIDCVEEWGFCRRCGVYQ